MDKEIVVRLHSSFEDMVQKHAETGTEFWCARDLQMLLGYAQWKNFAKVVDKAITACQTAGYDPKDHFAGISKMVDHGSGAQREIDDIALFGGRTTQDMKARLRVPTGRPLADFLPTITIKAKDFANEITNFNIKERDLRAETRVTDEHVKNNRDVRKLLSDRGIVPEALPPAEDVKKVERRLNSEQKKLPKAVEALDAHEEDAE